MFYMYIYNNFQQLLLIQQTLIAFTHDMSLKIIGKQKTVFY